MICCIKCFKDQEIVNIIKSNKRVGNCEICNTQNTLICEAGDLKDQFDGLLGIYAPVSTLPFEVPTENVMMLKDFLYNTWNIFNIDQAKIQTLIAGICSEKYVELPALFNTPVTIPELNDQKYMEDHSFLQNCTWDEFVQEIKYKNRFHMQNKISLEVFEGFFDYFVQKYTKNTIFYRSRIVDNGKVFSKRDMGAPDKDNNFPGRANPKGIVALYLSSDIETTIFETRARVYDLVTVGKFILKNDINVVSFSDIDKISPFLEDFDITHYAINKPGLSKISSEIAKPMKRQDSELDYLPTQYLTEFVKSKGYDGIQYDSTIRSGGVNLAIFNQDNLKCTKASLYEITSLEYAYRLVT